MELVFVVLDHVNLLDVLDHFDPLGVLDHGVV
jgi:hypothetical protein